MCVNLEIIDQVQSRKTLRQFCEKPKTDNLPSIDTISYGILSPYSSVNLFSRLSNKSRESQNAGAL
jgi:hypothetical protein